MQHLEVIWRGFVHMEVLRRSSQISVTFEKEVFIPYGNTEMRYFSDFSI